MWTTEQLATLANANTQNENEEKDKRKYILKKEWDGKKKKK